MTFQELNLNTALYSALDDLGYTIPTTIQHKVFPIAMSGKDVCGIAQTGTGKTMAYLLPCLKQWKFDKNKDPQILIVVPTRELVVQVVETVKKLSSYLSLDVVGVYGGVNINTQQLEVEKGVDVLVATPGRLFDLAMNGAFKTKYIKKLVIDEVDEMMNLGFRTQLRNIMDLLPKKRQNLLFSATITEEVESLMETYFNAPVRVEAAPTGTPLDNIEQSRFNVPNFYTKVNLLELLLEQDATMTKVLVFTATKKLADQLFESLEKRFEGTIGIIHSNKEQNHRFNTVKQFKEGVYRFIIATDIVARGIDIAEVTHVINFDTPDIPENYIHRIGRTGRFDKKGIAISFTTEKEMPFIVAIEQLMKYEIPVTALPEHLSISDILTEDEKPKVYMKVPYIKPKKKSDAGPAFHEKSAKNQKRNVKVRRKDEMKKKYGKPIKRGAKK
ncbi:MAG: DEAD/DEAH box helicase [Sphingobacteriia bacterium 24-36-13]|jgi:ATP-dependent RNA helicase RhlE|uniref:DEAD/DEAH box helicase n=1 Tax=Sediminibacterium sp. TaxID=1917865 RepID=UPI000BD0CBF7|nr:DEAD/DEAH box helicase [Sediminibacterium sp.]OYY09594.1 MAG: DEAD/DEAH box helicase [Sphingobacteriia bacterium 35-36-14]OYZ53497.1 MAG: DEAD/DEAH box helicase [Sphingobacteriia bacterium 24-36-13]HQS25035.1 DEAD/DEAH box helicase [Sediminibacterium sp.]HQS36140.1 DEAD/DEAH box helicase [Sediminibacterium sp.]